MADLSATAGLSILTWVELEGGVYANAGLSEPRRRAVDVLIHTFEIIPFDPAVVHAYGRIVAARGFARRQIIDRMIAATAIAHGLTLVTINGADFRDIPGLALEIWPAPAAQ